MAISQATVIIRATVTTPDLADDPDVFPHLPGQQFPRKSPMWSTTALKSKSGRIFRLQNYTYPIWSFNVAYSSLSQKPGRADLDRLWAFFNARAGGFGDFFFWDPYDNVVDRQVVGKGDGATTSFQLIRSVRSWTEPVFVLSGPPTIMVDWVKVTNYTITAPGVITFSSPPAKKAIISWTGSFLFWCHFTQDELDVQQMNYLLWSNDGLSFETAKP